MYQDGDCVPSISTCLNCSLLECKHDRRLWGGTLRRRSEVHRLSHEGSNAAEIAGYLEVSERTVYRDLAGIESATKNR